MVYLFRNRFLIIYNALSSHKKDHLYVIMEHTESSLLDKFYEFKKLIFSLPSSISLFFVLFLSIK